MPFKRYVEIGRVALVTYGEDYGKLVVISDVVDQNRVSIWTQLPRHTGTEAQTPSLTTELGGSLQSIDGKCFISISNLVFSCSGWFAAGWSIMQHTLCVTEQSAGSAWHGDSTALRSERLPADCSISRLVQLEGCSEAGSQNMCSQHVQQLLQGMISSENTWMHIP